MTRLPRRTVLKIGGALLGGITAGTSMVVAERSNRFVVDTKGVPDRKLREADLEVVHDLGSVDYAVVRGAKEEVRGLTSAFAADTQYSLDLPAGGPIEPDGADVLDEPLYSLQWDKQAQDLPGAHEVTRGEGTRVAILDSGIDADHPDLSDAVNRDLSENVADGSGFEDPIGHGTHVSGIVAADDGNEFGTVGSAPGTDLVMLRISDDEGNLTFGTILAGIARAVAVDADVANMSFGAYPVPRQRIGKFYGKVLNRLTTYANANGTLLIAAVGNDAADLQHDKGVVALPSEAANVMNVSATGPVGFGWGEPGVEQPTHTPAHYTNYGTNVVDVSAPGGNFDLDAYTAFADDDPETTPPPFWFRDWVLSTVPIDLGYYGYIFGTSMAAPQVTGAAALLKSVDPSLNPNQVRQTLKRTATDEGKKGRDPYHGAGFIDPVAAIKEASEESGGRGKGNGR